MRPVLFKCGRPCSNEAGLVQMWPKIKWGRNIYLKRTHGSLDGEDGGRFRPKNFRLVLRACTKSSRAGGFQLAAVVIHNHNISACYWCRFRTPLAHYAFSMQILLHIMHVQFCLFRDNKLPKLKLRLGHLPFMHYEVMILTPPKIYDATTETYGQPEPEQA